MRTTTLSAVLASMLAIGCVPIGSTNEDRNRVDAGGSGSSDAADPDCDTSNIAVQSGDFNFTSDASLTALPKSCWQLAGKLTIDGSITSLAKLGDLRSVGDLVITDSGLTTINTPNPLAVTGSIDIETNSKLSDLSNLSLSTGATGGSASTCTSFLTAVTLKGNTALTSMGGMNQLGCVIGLTDIESNTKLNDIDLSNAIRLEGGLTITGNTAATTLELGSLTSVTGAMVISGNTALTNLGQWSSLQFMHGPLTIDGNSALSTLAGVMNGAANGTVGTGIMIEGELSITNNAKLTELGEFQYLSWAQQINIANNAQLDYCEAREVGCCVIDSSPSNVNMAAITANKDTTCNGASSWCFGGNNNRCHNDYTGYNMNQGIE
ncbi:MAG TPA: hypothetical protein VGG28_28365 [Kofleriaceae bacterium]|jgi:hypothetical protein